LLSNLKVNLYASSMNTNKSFLLIINVQDPKWLLIPHKLATQSLLALTELLLNLSYSFAALVITLNYLTVRMEVFQPLN